jgi:proteasome lid subunit RPN8/RPN11
MFGWLFNLFDWRKREPRAEPRTLSNRLESITLTEGVAQTLRDDFDDHRCTERGHEEIGWILLGIREGNDAIALAALPAGANRDASWGHVQFNCDAQTLASRILRQEDKRLQIIGVVHTHPGSMRYPSDGDLHGDRQWVAQLRNGEGVFAIGTADARVGESSPHLQVFTDTCFSWYALSASDKEYRPLLIRTRPGSDLAGPLRAHWATIESHAVALNRLFRQLAIVRFSTLLEDGQNHLVLSIALAEKNQQLRLLLSDVDVRYYWEKDGELIAVDPLESNIERGVYRILAELAKDSPVEARTLVES